MYPPLSLSHCLYTYGPYISGEVVCVVILSISISKEEEKCVIHTCSYVSDVLLEMQSKVCVRKHSFADNTQTYIVNMTDSNLIDCC